MVYKIKIDNKWISKDNILMLTDSKINAACLNEEEKDNIYSLLSLAYGNKIKIIEV